MSDTRYTLITVAGWEERFIQGLTELLNEYTISEIKLIEAEEYKADVRKNAESLKLIAETQNVDVETVLFRIYDNTFSWSALETQLNFKEGQPVLFDISTAPREIIWFVLHFLQRQCCKIRCVYSKPAVYGSWLSKDPGRPRLVFNHSGITQLGRPTALLIISGFDLERTNQLIQFFEPRKTFIALQTGTQYENHKLNVENHLHRLEQLCEIQHFEIDTFAEDGGFSVLDTQLAEPASRYNIIATSLGPKPSAIALFELQRCFQQIALCYVPSLSYNTKDYSRGFEGYMDVSVQTDVQTTSSTPQLS